jgi:hypothetical protein
MSGISSQQKEESSKKGGARIEKHKSEASYEELRVKKKRMKFTSCYERFYQKKERKEVTFSYSAKFDVWPHPYPHIICICTTFYSLTFPFLTSIHYTILHQP